MSIFPRSHQYPAVFQVSNDRSQDVPTSVSLPEEYVLPDQMLTSSSAQLWDPACIRSHEAHFKKCNHM